MLELMVERLKRISCLDGIVIATTVNDSDDCVAELARNQGVDCYRGSENDVMSRILEAARKHQIDIIVETTGDCPLIDPEIVEKVIRTYLDSGADYVSNVIERTFPWGMDTEVFSRETLEDAASRTDDPVDHEHVSVFLWRNPQIYKLVNVPAPFDLANPDLRLTLDTREDFRVIDEIFSTLYPQNPEFSLADILELIRKRPEISEFNRHIQQKKLSE